MPDPTDNPVVSAPKGAPPRDTGGDTTAGAGAGQKLLQSASGDKSSQPQTTDHSHPQSPTAEADTRTLWVSEFMSIAGDAKIRSPGQSSRSTADANATPENIVKGFADLEQQLTRNGMQSTRLEEVSKQFESLRQQGKLPRDLSAIKACLDRLNKDGSNDTLTSESSDTILRLVSSSLNGKVKLLTPESAPAVAVRPVYNRENPDYEKADQNCRACTGAFIINDRLSDRAMLLEFDKVLEQVEAGKTKLLLIPVENGVPKMTADAFEVNYGATHTGSPGTVYSIKEQEAFAKANPPVHDYIRNGLNKAGFSDLTLPGGPVSNSYDDLRVMKEPGLYVLEHPTSGGPVSGHVTAAYVDQEGKTHRIDTQIPDNRDAKWAISHVYKVTTGAQALEEKSYRLNPVSNTPEQNTRVINPDGTIRDFNFSRPSSQLQSLTDVDGRTYFRNQEGQWQTMKQGRAIAASFKNVEYLGTTDGTRFTFEDHTVTEKPNGTAEISVPDRAVKNDGTSLKVNGTDAKVSDLVSRITRNTDGSISVQFKDNSTRVIEPNADNPKASDTRNIQQLEAQLKGLDGNQAPGTTGGDSLNRVIMGRIQEEAAKGSDLGNAVLKLLKPNASGADVERMSRISEAMRMAGMPTDPSTISKIDTIMTELKLSTEDIGKAKAVLDKSQELLKKSQTNASDKAPLTERQALEIAILQNTPNPAKPDKNYTEASAKALLKKVDEIRFETRAKDVPLSTALEVLRLRDQYSGAVLDSFFKTPNGRPLDATEKGNEIRNLYKLALDPRAMAEAEVMFNKLGGSASGITLLDAAAINANPRLKDNPDFAREIMTEARLIRSRLIVPATKYRNVDFLEMGLLAHDHEKSGSPLKANQIEDAFNRSKIEARRAAREADSKRPAESEASAADRTGAEKPPGDATTNDTSTNHLKVEPAQPSNDSYRVLGFRAKVAALDALPANQMRDECFRTALRETAGSVNSKRHRPAFADTPASVVESDHLQPGESKLAITHDGKPIEVKSLDSGGTLAFVTADGTKIPLAECEVEMQCGKGSTNDQIAREALVRSIELKDLFEGKANDPAHRSAQDQLVKAAFEKEASAPERAGQGVAEHVAKLGAFELQGGRETVFLTETGVSFGGKPEVTFETLVKETLKDKRQHLERLEKTRGSGENAELDGQIKILNDQIADLDHLSKNVHRPETMAKLMETIKKHSTEEIERMRAEKTAGGGRRAAGTVTRAGTYSLVAAFVAQMIFNQNSSQDTEQQRYAPSSF